MLHESDDPHYLHGKTGLSVVVRPPVHSPSAMAWTDDGRLVVSTRTGHLLFVHPAMGTRPLDRRSPANGIGVRGDRIVVFEQDGTWIEMDVDGAVRFEGRHPFVDRVQVRFHEDRVIVTGATSRDRQTLFYENGKKVFRVRLPPRAVAFIDFDARVGLAQATEDGLEVVRMQPGSRFSSAALLPHDLEVEGEHIVGVTGRGVAIWNVRDGSQLKVPLDGTTAASLAEDARWLGMGTWTGGVALVDVTSPSASAGPSLVQASEQPITTIALGRKGQWMATGADDLILWTWDA